tara:strand:- start:3344 stop:4390 length:1047 start_codon:yes stop_codon:yes gene_type:complete
VPKNKKNDTLFKKAACFTDIHFGLKNNSHLHNEDCLNFVKWFINTAKENNCETCIFLGDWHHQRASINVSTMNYTLKALALLNESFETVYFINGNHDLYYRDTRALNSIEFNKLLSNFIQINEPIVKDNVAFVPWLVGDEWKQIQKIKCKYMFGHFELPHFYMNAKIQMPDLGGLKEEKFKHPELVFSGHFHTRQAKDKIIYIGNAFPHNYADAWDDERGMMMLDWGHDPEFITWPDQPTYRTLTLSLLLEDPEKFLQKKTNARINLDTDITYEEANFLKELFTDIFKLRDFALLPTKDTEHEEGVIGKIQFQSIDQIVISHLQNIESDTFDSRVLIAIYNSLQYAKN